MELVEAEDQEGAQAYLAELLGRYRMEEVDAIVLGCTHYVFLKDMIRSMIPAHVALTDGNAGTARQLRRVLEGRGLLREEESGGRLWLMTSGGEQELEKMRKWADGDFQF